MAQLTFFNPETGEKLFEGEGQVFRTDQPDMINNGPWGNPQADPMQELQTAIDKMKNMPAPDPDTLTVYGADGKGRSWREAQAEFKFERRISRRKWKRLKRAFTMQRPRIPRKLKKAARHIHIEIVNENFNVVEPFSKGGSDVNLQVDVDYRIRVDGRRTRSVERMVAKARWMLSKAYRDMVQHHIDEMKKACKPGMLTYEPPVVPEKPAVYTQPDSGYLVMSKEQMQRIASLVVPETLVPSEETAEQIRRDDIHLHSCHDCPHWQDGDEGPQCEYPDCPPCNDNS